MNEIVPDSAMDYLLLIAKKEIMTETLYILKNTLHLLDIIDCYKTSSKRVLLLQNISIFLYIHT